MLLFGTILNSDQALQAILDQALMVGCDWTKDTPTSGSPAQKAATNTAQFMKFLHAGIQNIMNKTVMYI